MKQVSMLAAALVDVTAPEAASAPASDDVQQRNAMKKRISASLPCPVAAAPGFACGDPINVTLESVLEMPEAELDNTVKFYLAGKSPKGAFVTIGK